MKKNASMPFFLLSFIPAVGYWLLETYFSLEVALTGGIALGLIEIITEKIYSGRVHTLSKLNISLIFFLGGISLLAREGIWFKLQPTITGISLFIFLLVQKWKGKSFMVEMLEDFNQKPPLPLPVYKILEWHLALFLLAFAIFMGVIAFYEKTSVWLFWKTGGFYLAFFVFMIFELFFLRWLSRGPK
jgi:intracellular septation protein